jgi:hypothetical protein
MFSMRSLGEILKNIVATKNENICHTLIQFISEISFTKKIANLNLDLSRRDIQR